MFFQNAISDSIKSITGAAKTTWPLLLKEAIENGSSVECVGGRFAENQP